MIDRLSAVGYPVIEVTNFAHPKVIPNLSDAEEVMARIKRRPGTVYRALVPNARGAERAAKTDCDEMLGLITVSKTYLAKNQNMERDEAIDQGVKAFEIAEKAGAKFIMALGMALGVPMKVGSTKMIPWPSLNGTTMPASGASISPGPSAWKTRGTSTRYSPARPSVLQTRNSAGTSTTSPAWEPPTYCRARRRRHLDRRGNLRPRRWNRMPTTMGSVGNFPSEDIVHMLNEMGIETGVDTVAAKEAAADIAKMIDIEPRSHITHCGTRTDVQLKGQKNPRAHPV